MTLAQGTKLGPYEILSQLGAGGMGVEMNPEALLAQYRSGVPDQQLLATHQGPSSAIPDAHAMS